MMILHSVNYCCGLHVNQPPHDNTGDEHIPPVSVHPGGIPPMVELWEPSAAMGNPGDRG